MDEFRRALIYTYSKEERQLQLGTNLYPSEQFQKKRLTLPRFLFRKYNVQSMLIALAFATIGSTLLGTLANFNQIKAALFEQNRIHQEMLAEISARAEFNIRLTRALLFERDLMAEQMTSKQIELESAIDTQLSYATSALADLAELNSRELLPTIEMLKLSINELKTFNTELVDWIQNGDPDLAANLYFDRGHRIRNNLEFQIAQLESLGDKHQLQRVKQLSEIDDRTSHVLIFSTLLVLVLVAGSALLSRRFLKSLKTIADALRRESYFAFKATRDNSEETSSAVEHIANLRIQVSTLTQLLFGNASGERQSRPGQVSATKDGSEFEKPAA